MDGQVDGWMDGWMDGWIDYYMVKNGRMHLAYLHLTDPALTHSTFRASANGYVWIDGWMDR